ncbi:t-SNARE [Ochromonadaceae sp. CCMP2298]|nr:t-SNARE [Ochromonadaceae sp. CCMP2298]
MDRLKELQKGAKQLDESETESDRVSLVNVANSSSSGAGQADLMQQFFGDIEIIKSNVVVIREATRKIAEINQNVLQATTTEREQDSSYELEPIVKNTNKKASLAKQLLQRLREDTERMKTSNEGAKMTPEIRIRENLANTLTRKFVDVMKEYQNAQTKYKTDIKKKVKRQVQIVKPDATSEEIDAVFKSGGGSGDVLKSAILSGEAAESVQNAYMNVADKYQDVLTLEASVAELHQMFLDFALLTEQQGELLDQIEHQVKEAGEYVDSGNKELVESIELQKSIRAKQCCICVIILVVIGIIAGIVAAKTSGGFR